jgi:hypothetical protein
MGSHGLDLFEALNAEEVQLVQQLKAAVAPMVQVGGSRAGRAKRAYSRVGAPGAARRRSGHDVPRRGLAGAARRRPARRRRGRGQPALGDLSLPAPARKVGAPGSAARPHPPAAACTRSRNAASRSTPSCSCSATTGHTSATCAPGERGGARGAASGGGGAARSRRGSHPPRRAAMAACCAGTDVRQRRDALPRGEPCSLRVRRPPWLASFRLVRVCVRERAPLRAARHARRQWSFPKALKMLQATLDWCAHVTVTCRAPRLRPAAPSRRAPACGAPGPTLEAWRSPNHPSSPCCCCRRAGGSRRGRTPSRGRWSSPRARRGRWAAVGVARRPRAAAAGVRGAAAGVGRPQKRQ